MDKGQHLRLFITENSSDKVVALSTELSLHGSAQTENSTTKDTTDSTGAVWDENDVVGRTYDINFSALIASGTDTGGKTFADILAKVDDEIINWKIALASGEQNRTMGRIIVSGQGKFTNVQATGQVSQQSVYSGTINGYGPLVPGPQMTPIPNI